MTPRHQNSPSTIRGAEWPWRLTLAHAMIASRRERGTVLLMVVGVLALLAIIGVVYATIGRADRSMSATIRRQQQINDQADEVAAYIAGVIGDASHAQYVERADPDPAGSGVDWVARTRRYTYPWTDEHFLSVNVGDLTRSGATTTLATAASTYSLFKPTGENTDGWADYVNSKDPRNPSDPYLATLEPEWLRLIPNDTLNAGGQLYNIRDWRHISNLSPSGNFVNLANVRKNKGGFSARPGFGTNQMSFGLTLYGANGAMQPVGPQTLPHRAGDPARTANPANPADWSNNQVFAYRPAVPEGGATLPGDYEYILNQWADTDGDGFLDARWFELTDISQMFGNANVQVGRQVVPTRGRYRLFCAARVIDNSAKINVNVASDMVEGPYPTATFRGQYPNGDTRYLTRDDVMPPGMSPADVGLNRVLRLTDVNLSLKQVGAGLPLSYSGLPQPSNAAWDRGSTDYSNYNTQVVADNIGNQAYTALIDARRRGSTAIVGVGTQPTGLYRMKAFERYQHFDIFASDPRSARNSTLYGTTTTGTADSRVLRSPYDLGDELELISFFGVNDSSTLSRLEATLGGRGGTQNFSPLRDNRSRALEMSARDEFSGTAPSNLFVPANGEASLLAAYTDIRHLLTTVSGARPVKDSSVAPDPNQSLNAASTDVSAALKAIREYAEIDPATTPTAAQIQARQKAIQLIFKLYANALAPFTDRDNYVQAWPTALSSTNAQARMGLYYGGNPELAIRLAAHMTVNLVDAFDRDRRLDATGTGPSAGRPFTDSRSDDRNEPTVVSLQLANTITSTSLSLNSGLNAQRAFDDGTAGVTLNINGSGTPPTTNSRLPELPSNIPSHSRHTSTQGKMRIFGVEAQPFLTEIGTFALYTDAPHFNQGGGDDDAASTDDTTPLPLAEPFITIRMTPKLTGSRNSDFICEVIAFQLNNPFDQDVILFDPNATARADKHRYYIEFAGRYYTFQQQDRDTVSLGSGAATVRLRAGYTQTFYVVNPGTLKAVGQRIKKINENTVAGRKLTIPGPSPTDAEYTDIAENWIKNQLKTGNSVDPIQLTQVIPTDFTEVLPLGGPADLMPDMDLWGESLTPLRNQAGVSAVNLQTLPHSIAERRVCNLWRTLRSGASLYSSTIPGGGSTDETSTTHNDPSNDLLADRMHDPSDAGAGGGSGYLWGKRDINDGDNVGSAVGLDERSTTSGGAGANTGFTAVMWAAIRRPTDSINSGASSGTNGGTLDPSGRPFRGVLPPWCLEARSDNKWAVSNARSLNKTFNNSVEGHGSENDYGGPTSKDRFKVFRDAIEASNAANSEIGKPCARKGRTGGSNPIGKTKDTLAAHQREYSQVAIEYHSVGEDIYGGAENPTTQNVPPSGAAIRRSRNPALFSRAGDFLLPLAVGPWFDPTRLGSDLTSTSPNATLWLGGSGSVNTVAGDREAGWMTLSEALALACGYYSPDDQFDPLYEFGVSSPASGPNAAHVSKSDRGHLVLNAFTPFMKAAGSTVNQPLGSGVPFALGIIDQFRAAGGISSTPKLVGTTIKPEQQTRDLSFGGGSASVDVDQRLSFLTRVEGTINLNTAPLNVVRTLPMIAPEEDTASWFRQPGNYYISSGTGLKLYDPADATMNPDYDIAPMIKAYRDLSREEFRQNGSLGARQTPDFGAADARKDITQPPVGVVGTVDDLRREARGIKSLGELVAINDYQLTTTTDLRIDHNSMMRFSDPDRTSAGAVSLPTTNFGSTSHIGPRISFQPSVLSARGYNHDVDGRADKAGPTINGNGSALYYALGGNELPRGYQEKLTVINALTNTASVYSDVFTVYFVINGYTPEDCDIEDSQPLVPSVAKRYVMVVDRSNVLSSTDKPRILMLKEVPMQ